MDSLPTESRRPSRHGTQRRATTRIGLIVVISCTFLAGILTGEVAGPGYTDASGSISDQPGYETLQQVWDLIHDQFVDPDAIDDTALLYGAARGMVNSLGDTGHSSFLDPDEATAFRSSLSGELVGLGISLEYDDREPVIVAPIKNSPAEKAGLLPGDVIVEIDGVPTLGMTDAEVGAHLRGDVGTPVTLTIERNGAPSLLDVTVIRGRIDLDPVTWAYLPDGTALVQFHEFSADSSQALNKTLTEIMASGTVDGIVLDLRNNPGGLVSEAISVASQFMPEGTTVYIQQERDGKESSIDTIGNDGPALEIPMVVLVNRASASAAEMIAGSLRDNGRAEMVGERTYGTGTVVSTYNLDGGSALALGTSFWKTPDGDLAWKIGLTPDVEVRQSDSTKIIDIIDGETVTRAQLDSAGDAQLGAALEALQQSEAVAA